MTTTETATAWRIEVTRGGETGYLHEETLFPSMRWSLQLTLDPDRASIYHRHGFALQTARRIRNRFDTARVIPA